MRAGTDGRGTDRSAVQVARRVLPVVALPVAALLTLQLAVAPPVPGGLVVLGLVVAVDRLVALRRLGGTDRLLVDVGGVLVTTVLTGMVLGSTPVGLSEASWVTALALVTLGALCISSAVAPRASRRQAPAPRRRVRGHSAASTVLWSLPWVAVAVVVVAVAVTTSTTSLDRADVPPLQVSLGQVHGSRVEVVVSDSAAIGPLEVRTSTDGAAVSYPQFSVGAGGTATITVRLPLSGRSQIAVGYPGQTQPLRTLVLDR